MKKVMLTISVLFSVLAMFILLAITPVLAQGSVSSVTNTEFSVYFPNATCIIPDENTAGFDELDLGVSYWKEPGNDPAPSRTRCFIADGIHTDGRERNTCCIPTETCDEDTGMCEPEPGVFASCGDYQTPDDCVRDSGHPEKAEEELRSVLIADGYPNGCDSRSSKWSNICQEFFRCKCVWDSGVCKPKSTKNYVYTASTPNRYWDDTDVPDNDESLCSASGPSNLGACIFEFTIDDDCSDGRDYVTRTWTAVFENNADDTTCDIYNPCDGFGIEYYCGTDSKCTTRYCQRGSEEIACERVVRLNFFSTQNIIIAIIIIILIYWYRSKKKKK